LKIGDLYGPGKFGLSLEIFPPKTERGGAAPSGTSITNALGSDIGQSILMIGSITSRRT